MHELLSAREEFQQRLRCELGRRRCCPHQEKRADDAVRSTLWAQSHWHYRPFLVVFGTLPPAPSANRFWSEV